MMIKTVLKPTISAVPTIFSDGESAIICPKSTAVRNFDMMKWFGEVLKDHPVNTARKARGLKPANSAWF